MTEPSRIRGQYPIEQTNKKLIARKIETKHKRTMRNTKIVTIISQCNAKESNSLECIVYGNENLIGITV
jgi:hypothetical protein